MEIILPGDYSRITSTVTAFAFLESNSLIWAYAIVLDFVTKPIVISSAIHIVLKLGLRFQVKNKMRNERI